MLDNERFKRATKAARQYPGKYKQAFLDQEYLTQQALASLGATKHSRPSEVSKVGCFFMQPEEYFNLRVPYIVEVLGMPRAGKSTTINRWLESLWESGQRHRVHLINEGVRAIKPEYGGLRYTDPYEYSFLGGTQVLLDQVASLENAPNGLRVVVTDRGRTDLRVFRRTLFTEGKVDPAMLVNEVEYTDRLENSPLQIGAIIMLLVRSKVSIKRNGGDETGPVVNRKFLPLLYEQYLRLHYELLQGDTTYRVYAPIDGEQDKDTVYKNFAYAMDIALNLHETALAAIATVFPKEYERGKAEFERRPNKMSPLRTALSRELGGRVLIAGGDDMESEEGILKNPFIEGYRLTKT